MTNLIGARPLRLEAVAGDPGRTALPVPIVEACARLAADKGVAVGDLLAGARRVSAACGAAGARTVEDGARLRTAGGGQR